MKLRHQLLLVSLLTLVLPWAGARYTLALERAQRADRAAVLQQNAELVERILSARLERLPDPLLEYRDRDARREVYAHRLTTPVLVDGSHDDWRPSQPMRHAGAAPARNVPSADGGTVPAFGLSWQAAIGERFLFFFVDVRDGTPTPLDPAAGRAAAHDHLVLVFDAPDGARQYVRVASAATGPLIPHRVRDDAALPRLRAFLRRTPQGYAVELRIPVDLVGDRFGFSVLDAAGAGAGERRYRDSLGTLPLDLPRVERPYAIGTWRAVTPGLLIRPAQEVTALLADLARGGQRLSVVDSAGWRISSAGNLSGAVSAGGGERVAPGPRRDVPVAGALLRWLLAREDADAPTLDVSSVRPEAPHIASALDGTGAAIRYLAADGPRRPQAVVLSAAHPVRGRDGAVLGAVLVEQSTEQFLTLTEPAFAGLIQSTLLASLIAALGLLGYATLLSLRIGRLRNAAERAADDVLRPGGRLEARMPLTGAGDELGDLARSFQMLLARLRQQTEYLQTLAGKLSHELRTPLTIVQSSLENLSAGGVPPAEADSYVKRAQAGGERLRAILTAMSEATRLEQSMGSAEFERFDLAGLLRDMAQAYRDIHPDRDITLETEAPVPYPMQGAPELLVQMLDKLVDNAAGFSPPGSRIELRLAREAHRYVVAVSNRGPALPETMRDRLFDSMVSVRAREERAADDAPHLGLGLYIARLVAELHGGAITAQNRPDGDGVTVRVHLATRPDGA